MTLIHSLRCVLKMSQTSDAYVLYNAITMVSKIETDLFIIFRAKFQCIEVACNVLGINEDVVYVYMDYASLLPFLPNDSGKDQSDEQRSAKRINAIVECLLAALALNSHPINPLTWCLTVRKDSILETALSNTILEQTKPRRRTSIDISTVVLSQPPEGLNPFDVTRFATHPHPPLPLRASPHRVHRRTSPDGKTRSLSLDTMLGVGASGSPGKGMPGVSKMLGKVWLQGSSMDEQHSGSGSTAHTPRHDGPSLTPDVSGSPDASWERLFTQKGANSTHMLPEISTGPGMHSSSSDSLPGVRTNRIVSLPSISAPSQRHVYDFFFTPAPTPKAADMHRDRDDLAAASEDMNSRRMLDREQSMRGANVRRGSFGQQLKPQRELASNPPIIAKGAAQDKVIPLPRRSTTVQQPDKHERRLSRIGSVGSSTGGADIGHAAALVAAQFAGGETATA